MAARKNKVTIGETWREKIRVAMLINRLHDCAFGKIELSASQLKAIEILLRKVAPDLAVIEHTGEITYSYIRGVPEIEDAEAWQAQRTIPQLN